MESNLTPLTEAQQILFERLQRLDPVTVPVQGSEGMVTAEDLIARERVPSTPISAMDGYALRYGEISVGEKLPLCGEVPAGSPYSGEIPPGHCVKIMTGAPVPASLDTVVRVEDTTREGNRIRFRRLPSRGRGDNVRLPGEDVEPGDVLVAKGSLIRSYEVGAAVLSGRDSIRVVPPPEVSLLITGSELVGQPGTSLGPGQIRDVNRWTLECELRRAGAHPVHTEGVPDDFSRTVEALRRAVETSDLVVSTGGISMGDHDHVEEALRELDARILFHGVNQKPGKPVAGATCGGTIVVALPGNIVSCLVGYELYVRPLVLRMRGQKRTRRPRRQSISGVDFPRDDKRHVFYRVRCSNSNPPRVRLSRKRQGSHMITTLTRAGGLVHIPPGETVQKGDEIEVMDLRQSHLSPRGEISTAASD